VPISRDKFEHGAVVIGAAGEACAVKYSVNQRHARPRERWAGSGVATGVKRGKRPRSAGDGWRRYFENIAPEIAPTTAGRAIQGPIRSQREPTDGEGAVSIGGKTMQNRFRPGSSFGLGRGQRVHRAYGTCSALLRGPVEDSAFASDQIGRWMVAVARAIRKTESVDDVIGPSATADGRGTISYATPPSLAPQYIAVP
jgi:hypothetical protein